MRTERLVLIAALVGIVGLSWVNPVPSAEESKFDPIAETYKVIGQMKVKPRDWPQWGGSYFRNNTPAGENIPTEWDVKAGKNVKWAARLGSQTYGNPVVANGKVYVGSNNGAGYVKRYPSKVDLGVLLCFEEETGKFLWQHSNEKLSTGRVHDWPLQGICCSPYVDGDRLWYVTSRGEVVCLDTEGFRDGKNNGPFQDEQPKAVAGKPAPVWEEKIEADVIWKLNMMNQLRVSQHNMCSCSLTGVGDLLFVNTGNGVDEGHFALPQPKAPSFICIDRNSGTVLWTDNSPGDNVLHGQWSSPGYGVFDGQAQVLFAGGDGWLYSFDPAGDGKGKSKLLWKFDGNPKESKYLLGGRATRNHFIGTPVVYNGLIYIGVGEDPEHGEGGGHLWCLDPTKRGDISPELVFNSKDPSTPIPPKRLQAAEKEKGDFTKENPNAGAVWHYSSFDANDNKKDDFEEIMHRTIGTVAIENDLLFVVDFSGVVHCVDANTGKPHWTHDTLDASWGSPLIVDGKVYCGTENGDVKIFKLSKEKELIAEVSVENSVYSTPVVANNVLFISNKDTLFAIKAGAKSTPLKANTNPQASDSAD
ncbi:MAG: PQQ-binding-like beta-propeller repeat protein [Planctomycetota bacterium]